MSFSDAIADKLYVIRVLIYAELSQMVNFINVDKKDNGIVFLE